VKGVIFREHGLHLRGLISEEDWEAVQQVLDIDYLVFGTINFTYDPGYSLAGKGYYYGSSASVRFVDTKEVTTAEPVVVDYTAIKEERSYACLAIDSGLFPDRK